MHFAFRSNNSSLVSRLSACGLVALLSACATTSPLTIAAQCDVSSADWRHLAEPPPEAVKLGPYFAGQQHTRPATIHWFESAQAPRELMACTPSVERSHDGRFTGCASIRMRFSAQVLRDGIDPARPIAAQITGC